MSYRADRHWWAYLLGALMESAIGVALPTWGLNLLFSTGRIPGAYAVSGQIFAGVAFLLAFAHTLRGVSGWYRMRRRHWALEGDMSAMSASIIEPDATDVFDVASEPLVLVWRSGQPLSASHTSTAQMILARAAVVVTFWFVVITSPLVLYRWAPALAASALAAWGPGYSWFIIASVLGISLSLVSAIISGVISRMVGDRLAIIEAVGEGIRFQPIIGRVSFMRWQDMRLLEVEELRRKRSDDTLITCSYTLYDYHRRVISWIERGSKFNPVQPEGITWDEIWALSRELVDVIYQRTDLIPRTFSKSLQRGPADVPSSAPSGAEWTLAEVDDAHA